MKTTKWLLVLIGITLFAACGTPKTKKIGENKGGKKELTEKQLKVTERPDSIKEKMKARGEQDQAQPELIVESPKEGEVINNSTVKIKVKIGGDLKGLKMGKDKAGTGNHVHVILDNQPYAAHYMWDKGFELRNITDGKHTLRMFASRPWHESYKNKKAFKTIKFTVKNGKADETKPTTDAKGKKLADAKPEGADVKESKAGDVDFSKPLVTYSRPKGTYKGENGKTIMIDFWLSNAKLIGDGGEFKIRYSVNGGEPKLIEKWAPIWLEGWKTGENSIKLELVDKDGNLVENGGYNSTARKIKVLE